MRLQRRMLWSTTVSPGAARTVPPGRCAAGPERTVPGMRRPCPSRATSLPHEPSGNQSTSALPSAPELIAAIVRIEPPPRKDPAPRAWARSRATGVYLHSRALPPKKSSFFGAWRSAPVHEGTIARARTGRSFAVGAARARGFYRYLPPGKARSPGSTPVEPAAARAGSGTVQGCRRDVADPVRVHEITDRLSKGPRDPWPGRRKLP